MQKSIKAEGRSLIEEALIEVARRISLNGSRDTMDLIFGIWRVNSLILCSPFRAFASTFKHLQRTVFTNSERSNVVRSLFSGARIIKN
jgi:hypothetical protein